MQEPAIRSSHVSKLPLPSVAGQHVSSDGFEVSDPERGIIKYEWWTEEIKKRQLYPPVMPLPTQEDAADIATRSEVVRSMLKTHGISACSWGIEKLVDEVLKGSSRLMLDATKYKAVVRVVDRVFLRLRVDDGRQQRLLVMTSERYPGDAGQRCARLPGTERMPHESNMQTVRRILNLQIGMVHHSDVDLSVRETFDERSESQPYPGVRAVHRNVIMEGKVSMQAVTELGMDFGTSYKYCNLAGESRTFSWLQESRSASKKVQYGTPKQNAKVLSLIQAPVGCIKMDELMNLLVCTGVDITQLHQGGKAASQRLASQLNFGEVALHRKSNGKVLCAVERVFLHLKRADGCSLVATEQIQNGRSKALNEFPSLTRTMDENIFHAARRIASKSLKLDDNAMQMQPEAVTFFDEELPSDQFFGMLTRVRSHFIHARCKRQPRLMAMRMRDCCGKRERLPSLQTSCNNVLA
eukprot:TRINITY_DN44896_c0_g1_i1.p1 TRINITY_DN44896_c0_g1~~TRINITY_DN44896_c0_g1_i1.p1  ORF type:complete len:467 (-),score=66.05 TRINITY_DN44896_c0_g1_i1:263-1663(-)